MLIFVAILSALGVLAAIVNPFAGLLVMLGIAVVQPGELFPAFDMLHVERVMAILVMVSYLLRYQRLLAPRPTKAVLIFWGAMFLTAPLGYWPTNTVLFSFDFGRTIIYHLLIVNLVTTPKRFRIFILTFTLLTAWLAASSLWAFHNGMVQIKEFGDRAEGLTSAGGDPNSLALTLVYALPLIFLTFTEGFSLWTLAGLATAGVAVEVLVLTGSRTGFVALCFLSFLYCLRKGKWPIFLVVGALLMGTLWIAIPQNYKDRYVSIKDRNEDESYTNRLLAWRAGWNMFLDNPATGVGAGNFTTANGGKYWPGAGQKYWLNAHSLYFKLLGEMGMLGVATFGFLVFTSLATARRLRKSLKEFPDWPGEVRHFPHACLLTLTLLLFAGYSSHNLYRQTWFMLAALLAALELMVVNAGTAGPKPLAGDSRDPAFATPDEAPARME